MRTTQRLPRFSARGYRSTHKDFDVPVDLPQPKHNSVAVPCQAGLKSLLREYDMTRTNLALALAAFAITPALAEEKRSADAHEHGHGIFRMAIEDDHAEIELEVPAFDVVGFEHPPSTSDQRQAIADAAAKLGNPAALFAVPEAAGCVAGKIEIGFGAVGGEDHDEHEDHDDEKHDKHDHGDDHDHAEKEHDDHDDHAHDEETHSEVTAHYHLACADTGALDQITFGYFNAFPNAEELDVVVLSAAGQSAGEVSGDNTVFEIE